MSSETPIPESIAGQAALIMSILEGKPQAPEAKRKDIPYSVSAREQVNRLYHDAEATPAARVEENSSPATELDPNPDVELTEPDDPALRPPPSWGGDAKALFAELPPALQTEIVKRESERDRGLHHRLSEIAAERQAIQSERQRAARDLDALIETARLTDPVLVDGLNTDWQALAAADPSAHQLRSAAFQRRMSDLRGAIQARDQLTLRIEQDQLEREGEALRQKLPEWSDTAKRAHLIGRLEKHLDAWGFQRGELEQLRDHRLLLLALDAASHREAQADPKQLAAKRVAGLPRVLRPGGSSTDHGDEKSRRLAAMKETALRSNSIRKEADYILRVLSEE